MAAPGAAAPLPPAGASRWVAVGFEQLPGWTADRSAEVWPALLKSCDRSAPAWATLCAEARLTAPGLAHLQGKVKLPEPWPPL